MQNRSKNELAIPKSSEFVIKQLARDLGVNLLTTATPSRDRVVVVWDFGTSNSPLGADKKKTRLRLARINRLRSLRLPTDGRKRGPRTNGIRKKNSAEASGSILIVSAKKTR